MSEPSAYATKDLNKALGKSTYLMQLTASNYVKWWEDLKNKWGKYKVAGREVMDDKELVLVPPERTANYDITYRADNGELKVDRKPWDSWAENKLNLDLKKYNEDVKELFQCRALYWSDTMDALARGVEDRLKSSARDEYEEARKDFNCVKLYRLIKTVCNDIGKDSLKQLRSKLETFFHKHPGEAFDGYLIRLNDLFQQLEDAGGGNTERQKTEHLKGLVDKDFWRTQLAPANEYAVSDDKYPQYDELTVRMARFWRETIGKTSKGKRRSEGEDAGGEAKHHKISKAQEASVLAMFTKVLEGHQFGGKKPAAAGKGKGAKQSGAAGKGKGKQSETSERHCWKCWSGDHAAGQCAAKDVLCATCNSSRHCTAAHAEVTAFLRRKAEKVDNRLMVATEVETAECNLAEAGADSEEEFEGFAQMCSVVGNHLSDGPSAFSKPVEHAHFKLQMVDEGDDSETSDSETDTSDTEGSESEQETTPVVPASTPAAAVETAVAGTSVAPIDVTSSPDMNVTPRAARGGANARGSVSRVIKVEEEEQVSSAPVTPRQSVRKPVVKSPPVKGPPGTPDEESEDSQDYGFAGTEWEHMTQLERELEYCYHELFTTTYAKVLKKASQNEAGGPDRSNYLVAARKQFKRHWEMHNQERAHDNKGPISREKATQQLLTEQRTLGLAHNMRINSYAERWGDDFAAAAAHSLQDKRMPRILRLGAPDHSEEDSSSSEDTKDELEKPSDFGAAASEALEDDVSVDMMGTDPPVGKPIDQPVIPDVVPGDKGVTVIGKRKQTEAEKAEAAESPPVATSSAATGIPTKSAKKRGKQRLLKAAKKDEAAKAKAAKEAAESSLSDEDQVSGTRKGRTGVRTEPPPREVTALSRLSREDRMDSCEAVVLMEKRRMQRALDEAAALQGAAVRRQKQALEAEAAAALAKQALEDKEAAAPKTPVQSPAKSSVKSPGKAPTPRSSPATVPNLAPLPVTPVTIKPTEEKANVGQEGSATEEPTDMVVVDDNAAPAVHVSTAVPEPSVVPESTEVVLAQVSNTEAPMAVDKEKKKKAKQPRTEAETVAHEAQKKARREAKQSGQSSPTRAEVADVPPVPSASVATVGVATVAPVTTPVAQVAAQTAVQSMFLDTFRISIVRMMGEPTYEVVQVSINNRTDARGNVLVIRRKDKVTMTTREWLQFRSNHEEQEDYGTMSVSSLTFEVLQDIMSDGTTMTTERQSVGASIHMIAVRECRRRKAEMRGGQRRPGMPRRKAYLDTGASMAVGRTCDTFGVLVPEDRIIQMSAANGNDMPVSMVGQVAGIGTVVVCPAASADVLSISELCSANPGLTVTFSAQWATIYHPLLDETIIAPKCRKGLYEIDMDCVRLIVEAGREQEVVLAMVANTRVTRGQTRAAQGVTPVTDTESPTTTETEVTPVTDTVSSVTQPAPETDVTIDTVSPGTEQTVVAGAAADAEEELSDRLAGVNIGETGVSVNPGTGVHGAVKGSEGKAVLTPKQVKLATELRFLHVSLGHPSDEQLTNLLKNGIVLGTECTARDVVNARTLFGECLTCRASKQVQPSYGESLVGIKPTFIGELVCCDIFPLLKESVKDPKVIGGYGYMLIAVDAFSSMLHIIPLENKLSRSCCDAFLKLISAYQRYGHKIKNIETDSEHDLKACSDWLGQRGVPYAATPPGQHCQRVERQVNLVKARMRCLINGAPLVMPNKLNGEIAMAAVNYLNDCTNTNHPTETPRMLFEGQKIVLRKRCLLPFGTVASFHYPEDKVARTKLGIVLGPAPFTYGASNCFVFETQKVVVRASNRMWPLEVLPAKVIPWQIKPGSETFTVPKRSKGHFNKRTVMRLPTTTQSDDVHMETGFSSGEDSDSEVVNDSEVPSGGDKDADGSLSHEVYDQLRRPKKVKVTTLSRPDTESTPANEANHAILLKRKFVQDQVLLQQDRKRLADITLENAMMNQKIQLVESMSSMHGTGVPGTGVPNSNSDPFPSSPDPGMSGTRKKQRTAGHPVASVTAEETGVPTAKSSKSKGTLAQQATKSSLKILNKPKPTDRVTRATSRNGFRMLLMEVARSGNTKAKEFVKLYKISVKEGLKGEHAQESREAIIGEILNMLHYKVGHYTHFRDIPQDKRGNILQSFMFLKHKTFPDGRYDKTKARMVGNGATQKEHMYDLVSSSTVALSSVFLLCNLASYYRAKLTTYDIKGAFLHAEFSEKDEVTFIRINKEITALWIEQDPTAAPFVDGHGTLLLELDKFIYGLKQSPLKFQLHLTKVLVELGYQQMSQDECLFSKHDGNDFSVLSTHVDDIMQVATSEHLYQELKDGLISAYADITTTEDGNAYLGMTIERDPKDRRIIKLSQRGLIDKVLEKYPKQPGDNHRYYSPSDKNIFDVMPGDDSGEVSPEARSEFLSVLMTLMYLARLTRPDVLMPVTFLAGRTHVATDRDISHLMRIVRYLDNTREFGVHINCESLQLHCSCDASFAVHTPPTSTKGHTGFIIGFGENMSYIHSRSGKQKLASTSSSDAEIIALCEALKMCYWMREVIRELGIADLQKIVVYQDNKSVIMMATESSLMKNSKHLLTKLTYVKDLVTREVVDVKYMETENMTSDVLSKALFGKPFYKHVTHMMGFKWSKPFIPLAFRDEEESE